MTDPVPEEQTIQAAIARVVDSYNDGTPKILEVDGMLYKSPYDQLKARKTLEESQRWDQIRAYGVSYDRSLSSAWTTPAPFSTNSTT